MEWVKLATELKKQMDASIKATQKLVKEVDLTDEELLELIDIYEDWENWVNKEIPKGERVKYNGELYEVIKGLLVLGHQTPDIVPSEYNVIKPAGIIPEWVQPTGAQNAYKLGDKVTYNGKTYESKIAANTTVPDGDKPHNRYWKEI